MAGGGRAGRAELSDRAGRQRLSNGAMLRGRKRPVPVYFDRRWDLGAGYRRVPVRQLAADQRKTERAQG